MIGGFTMSPDQLTSQIKDIKANLVDKSGNFMDSAIPQVGGNACKTNHDYTHGHLPELIASSSRSSPSSSARSVSAHAARPGGTY